MKKLVFLAALLLTTVAAIAQEPAKIEQEPATAAAANKGPDAATPRQNAYVRPDAKTRRSRYYKSLFGWESFARTAFTAGYGTAKNSPREWGPHWEGFAKRAASSLGKRAISRTIRFGLDEAMDLDSQFYRSKDKRVGPRILNAVISPVTARKSDGRRTVGIPRIIGAYTSNIIAAETWYPARYSYKDGLRSATVSLGTSALINLFKEFVRF